MLRRFRKIFLSLAILSSACMSTELTQPQLDNHCATNADCGNKDVYACRLPVCQANQCTAGEIRPPGTTCKTATCTGNCVCGAPGPKPGVPQGIGLCLPHS